MKNELYSTLNDIENICQCTNWNGYDSDSIPISIIATSKKVIDLLVDNDDIEIFPTARPSIQFEYEDNIKYVEMEVELNNRFKIWVNYTVSEEKYTYIYENLKEAVNKFNAIVEEK